MKDNPMAENMIHIPQPKSKFLQRINAILLTILFTMVLLPIALLLIGRIQSPLQDSAAQLASRLAFFGIPLIGTFLLLILASIAFIFEILYIKKEKKKIRHLLLSPASITITFFVLLSITLLLLPT